MTAPAESIHQLMAKVMGQVQAVGKAQRMQGARGFAFRGVDDVVNAVGPALRDHGVIVVPHRVTRIEQERYETTTGTKMHGVVITIDWRFYGPLGDWIEASSAGQSSDSGDKCVPKAHSVAYRTLLLQALCIPTDEADPDLNVHERGSRGQQAAPPSAEDEQRELIMAAAAVKGVQLPNVAEMYKAMFDGEDIRTGTLEHLTKFLTELGAVDVPA